MKVDGCGKGGGVDSTSTGAGEVVSNRRLFF
jgi:hypothetical protein